MQYMSYILLFENKKEQKVFHNDTVFPASCESWVLTKQAGLWLKNHNMWLHCS